ncbi:hypothetical protein FRC19_010277 [Serendipita sp. 401]|nr:hypothetical protein FRC19_010277 [Serendipita sp. 401]KAG9053403.1 hypothetical protein FS842_008253 [Serendipita sp. 407]
MPPAGVTLPPLTYAHLLLIGTATRVVRYVNYASFTFMVWDMLLTLPDEVKYIWKARWTVIKVVFLSNRYVTPIILIGNLYTISGQAKDLSDQRLVPSVLTTFEQVSLALVALIIILRLHAIWQAGKRSLYLLVGIWVSGTAASIGMLIQTFFVHKRLIYHETKINICFTLVPNLWYLWLPDVIMHGFLITFLVYKAIATPRSSQTRMLGVLYADGIIYYTVTTVAILTALLTWRVASYVWIGLPLYSCWMILNVAMSRLLLSLKSTQAVHLYQSRRRYEDRIKRISMDPNDMEMDEQDQDQDDHHVASPTRKVTFRSDPEVGPGAGGFGPYGSGQPTSFMEMQSAHGHGGQTSRWKTRLTTASSTGSNNNNNGAAGMERSDAASATTAESRGNGTWWWWLLPQRRLSRSSLGDPEEEEEMNDPYDYMRGHEKYLSWL